MLQKVRRIFPNNERAVKVAVRMWAEKVVESYAPPEDAQFTVRLVVVLPSNKIVPLQPEQLEAMNAIRHYFDPVNYNQGRGDEN